MLTRIVCFVLTALGVLAYSVTGIAENGETEVTGGADLEAQPWELIIRAMYVRPSSGATDTLSQELGDDTQVPSLRALWHAIRDQVRFHDEYGADEVVYSGWGTRTGQAFGDTYVAGFWRHVDTDPLNEATARRVPGRNAGDRQGIHVVLESADNEIHIEPQVLLVGMSETERRTLLSRGTLFRLVELGVVLHPVAEYDSFSKNTLENILRDYKKPVNLDPALARPLHIIERGTLSDREAYLDAMRDIDAGNEVLTPVVQAHSLRPGVYEVRFWMTVRGRFQQADISLGDDPNDKEQRVEGSIRFGVTDQVINVLQLQDERTGSGGAQPLRYIKPEDSLTDTLFAPNAIDESEPE